MITDIPMLRFMLLSSLVGFVVFCASYAILVWKKRHHNPAATSTIRTRLRRWSMTGVVLGCMGMLVSLVVREAVRSEGMVGGDDLYAVRATGDLRIVDIADAGASLKAGDVLARFSSPEAQAEIQKAEIDRNQAKADLESIGLQPLPRDPELVRQHSLAHSERLQLLSNLKSARESRETASRESLPHIIMLIDQVASKKAEIKSAMGDLKAAIVKRDIARQQLVRETELTKKQNTSLTELNERQKEVGSLEADVIKFESRLAADEETLRVRSEELAKLEKKTQEQDARLKTSIDEIVASIAALDNEKKTFDYQWAADATIAEKRQENAKAKQELVVKQAEIQLASKQSRIEQKAPFDGKVIYRHTSPSAAMTHSPVLVFSKTGSVQMHFRLPEDQVKALEKAGTIMVELEETANNVEQRFPGKFLRATTLDREPGMALVDLDCQAPPETVASLAEGKPIKARFSWRPPLLNLWPFSTSLILLSLGVFGLVIVNVTGWRPTWATASKLDEDSDDVMVTFTRVPMPKEGDTAEAAFDTIPVRPELPNVPRERPVQPWEHPVGIRLREAIIREEITAELMDAVENAIEMQKDAVIIPMREAMRRVPSVPQHARQLLDTLNNFETADEIKMIEKRCLAQRLTFLLYTLGMEIPSQGAENLTRV